MSSISRLGRLMRIAVAVIPATVIVIVSRLVRPIVLVRFGALKADRIGHFVLETELMLQEQEVGIRPRPPRSFDIYYVPTPVSNKQVERMWSRVIRIWPRWLMVAVFRLNRVWIGSEKHVVPSATSTALDVHCLLDVTQPKLSFSSEEICRGRELLDQLGIGTSEYVCVIARDAAYYRTALPNLDLSYHDYRNCDIDTYVLGMEMLADKGIYVLRMGAVVEKRLRTSHPRVIDYANSGFRSDFADIFLGANCKFCVSDGLGFFAIPAAFRRPNAYVNYSPFHMFYSSRKGDLGISKVFIDQKTQEVVPLRNLIGRGVARLTRAELLEESGLTLQANSPDEIAQLMFEMNERLDGTWVSHDESETLQKEFWTMFAQVIGPEGMKLHDQFLARFGETYLRSHHDWFRE